MKIYEIIYLFKYIICILCDKKTKDAIEDLRKYYNEKVEKEYEEFYEINKFYLKLFI